MKYIAYILVIFILSSNLATKPVFAVENISDASASLQNKVSLAKKDNRAMVVKDYLAKYNSVLIPYAEYIVKTADEHQIPWSMVVAISGVESTFCKRIPNGSSNCWGWNNGATYFKDYKEAIFIVSKTLRDRYFDRGLDTPEKIAPIYAPPSPSWGWKVRFFMNQIENYSTSNLLTSSFTI